MVVEFTVTEPKPEPDAASTSVYVIEVEEFGLYAEVTVEKSESKMHSSP